MANPTIYAEAAALATELLTADDDNFGQSTATHIINIMVRSDVAGATDLDPPTVTWTSTQVKAITRGVSEKRDGAEIFAKADKVVLIEATGVTIPRNEDKIEINGIEYAIVSVEPIPNGETPAVYRVFVKR